MVIISCKDNKKLVGTQGIIVNSTVNCFIIATRNNATCEAQVVEQGAANNIGLNNECEGNSDSNKRQRLLENSDVNVMMSGNTLFRAVKNNCVIGVMLPGAMKTSFQSNDKSDYLALPSASVQEISEYSGNINNNSKICVLYGSNYLPTTRKYNNSNK